MWPPSVLAALAFVCSQGAVATNTTSKSDSGHLQNLTALDSFSPSNDPFSAKISRDSLPQFVVLSITGGVTPLSYDLYRSLAGVRHKDGCPIVATWYVSVAQSDGAEPYTRCDLVEGLRRGGHEIATNAYAPAADPTEEAIAGAATWLNESCGVPREELRGFRAPFLAFTQSTFDRLRELNFLYDSSIADSEVDSNAGRTPLWPYTMDWGIAQDCVSSSGSCNQTKPNPGLWEVPLWLMFDEGDNALHPIDWQGDPYETLERNFKRRYNEGNRAPIGINTNAGWLAKNGEGLRKWAEEVLRDHDDVHFVTTYELLEWMRDPRAAWNYSRNCDGLVADCFPPPHEEGGCGNGAFDTARCECVCVRPYVGRNCLYPGDWTLSPTAAPTGAPSASPSSVPTLSPTVSPSSAPTLSPTVSHAPSASPSSLPTLSPTVSHAPTTGHPTLSPTATMRPTHQLTSSPTTRPTQRPTQSPTSWPTQPTASPTSRPTLPPVNVRSFSGGPVPRAFHHFFTGVVVTWLLATLL